MSHSNATRSDDYTRATHDAARLPHGRSMTSAARLPAYSRMSRPMADQRGTCRGAMRQGATSG